MIRLKQILVPTDFSEPSEAALNYGRELAPAFGAHLRILNVVDKLTATVDGPDGGLMPIAHDSNAEAADVSIDVRRTDALLRTGALQTAIFNSARLLISSTRPTAMFSRAFNS